MKRQMHLSGCLGLLIVLGFLGVVSAQAPRPGGTLRVAWEADITGLDPYLSRGVQSWHVVGNLFNSLLTIDTDLNYIPDLAKSWQISEDGKQYARPSP